LNTRHRHAALTPVAAALFRLPTIWGTTWGRRAATSLRGVGPALLSLGLLLFVTACGGGGGGSTQLASGPGFSSGGSGGSGGGATSTGVNYATITVDGGPAAVTTGPNGYLADNIAYVSVTLCVPGTSNCQTIDHVQLDTGSEGLRIVQSALNANLQAALPLQTDPSGNPVGECYGFVDGYTFGSVRQADFQIGGEKVANMPLQIVGDTGAFATVPSSCSSGGGTNLNSVQQFGANGIIGIGVQQTDCGVACTTPGGFSAATYYDCPTTGCSTIIARLSATSGTMQQLPNPVAAMNIDNNGSVIVLPTATSGGQTAMTGTVYFGIGTQSDNALGSAKVLMVSSSNSTRGSGLLTAVYNGASLNESFLDSGSGLYIFADNSIVACSNPNYAGFYCPSSTLNLNATLDGANGATALVNFSLDNAQGLFATTFAVLPGLGANPSIVTTAYPNSFDFGLPFFYGRSVFTAIEGRSAGGVNGPFIAF